LATVSTSFDESEQFADNEVELRRVGGVNAPVVSRDPVSNFLRQSHIDCRIVNWVTKADWWVQSRFAETRFAETLTVTQTPYP